MLAVRPGAARRAPALPAPGVALVRTVALSGAVRAEEALRAGAVALGAVQARRAGAAPVHRVALQLRALALAGAALAELAGRTF